MNGNLIADLKAFKLCRNKTEKDEEIESENESEGSRDLSLICFDIKCTRQSGTHTHTHRLICNLT